MTGTSADGIDLGIITTDGEKIIKFGAQGFFAYDANVRDNIKSWFGRDDIDPIFSEPAAVITNLHRVAIDQFLADHRLSPQAIDAIGFHGQTIYHAPQKKMTCQLGDGKALAETFNTPVVWQFRQRDVMMGGQGAPLMPLMHQAVADFFNLPRPVVFLNIGGVANITLVAQDDISAGDLGHDNFQNNLWAADVGPGNALIDDYAKKYMKKERDKDGAMASQGKADEALVARWMADGFFNRAMPKSLDRDYFAKMVWRDIPSKPANNAINNDLATLSFFTARAIIHAVDNLPAAPKIILVAGGGRHNQTIMNYLQAGLKKNTALKSLDAVTDKIIADNLEAYGFGFLAARVLRGLPLTLRTTTGVIAPTPGGVVSRPK